MTILRLRAEVADERGRLRDLASAIATCHGNILGLDVHFLDGERVADEFVIEFPEGHSGAALTTALRRAGGADVEAEALDQRAVVDPVARALGLASQVVGGAVGARRLEAAVAQLVRADRARLVDQEEADGMEALRRVVGEGVPVTTRGPLLRAPRGREDVTWVLVVPLEGGVRRRWMIVERASPRFSSSEVARVSALLRLAVTADRPARLGDATRPQTGTPALFSRRTATFFRPRPAVPEAVR